MIKNIRRITIIIKMMIRDGICLFLLFVVISLFDENFSLLIDEIIRISYFNTEKKRKERKGVERRGRRAAKKKKKAVRKKRKKENED